MAIEFFFKKKSTIYNAGMMTVSSNYFVATYIQKQTTCKLKRKEEGKRRNEMKKTKPKDNRITTLLYSTCMKFLLFLAMPNFVETVSPVRTSVTVCLVIPLAVDALEEMRARLTFLCSEPWRIYINVLFVAPCLLPMMLRFVRSIAFDIPGHM